MTPLCDQRWHKVLGHSVPHLVIGLVQVGQCQSGHEECSFFTKVTAL